MSRSAFVADDTGTRTKDNGKTFNVPKDTGDNLTTKESMPKAQAHQIQQKRHRRESGRIVPAARKTGQERKSGQDGACSCCSSDDELMLRSHSHIDLDAGSANYTTTTRRSLSIVRYKRRAKRLLAMGTRKRRADKIRMEPEKVADERIEDDELDLL